MAELRQDRAEPDKVIRVPRGYRPIEAEKAVILPCAGDGRIVQP
jgi:hypothetical protein